MRLRTITSQDEILGIIKAAQWCHMAMVDAEGAPYVIPMNFGFRDGVIYLHGAREGKKITILQNNPSVCLNFSTDQALRFQSEEVACSYSMKYRSVLAYGRVDFIEDMAEKTAALDIIMSQYSGRSFRYNPPSLREVCCWKVRVVSFEGRAFGL
jgi:nitroimidazol reductase NimA-like FMN-containing flavoprotein (pyridoxamine 5'-phosphate oxidase superfamily)